MLDHEDLDVDVIFGGWGVGGIDVLPMALLLGYQAIMRDNFSRASAYSIVDLVKVLSG